MEPFEYNADGTFPTILPTKEGAPAVGYLDPYQRVEAETMAWSKGVTTEQNKKEGVYVSGIHNDDYIKVANVNFMSESPKTFCASAASGLRGGTIEVRMDAVDGPLVAELKVPATGSWENFAYIEAPAMMEAPGIHDIYLVFKGRKGPHLMNLDYWQFK